MFAARVAARGLAPIVARRGLASFAAQTTSRTYGYVNPTHYTRYPSPDLHCGLPCSSPVHRSTHHFLSLAGSRLSLRELASVLALPPSLFHKPRCTPPRPRIHPRAVDLLPLECLTHHNLSRTRLRLWTGFLGRPRLVVNGMKFAPKSRSSSKTTLTMVRFHV